MTQLSPASTQLVMGILVEGSKTRDVEQTEQRLPQIVLAADGVQALNTEQTVVHITHRAGLRRHMAKRLDDASLYVGQLEHLRDACAQLGVGMIMLEEFESSFQPRGALLDGHTLRQNK